METFSRAAHWDRVYGVKGEAGVSWFEASPTLSLALIEAAGAAPTSAVIDIGGGASRLVDKLLDAGYRDVTVLDLSAAALQTAKARLGPASSRVKWILADVTNWEPTVSYDVWHDRAAFHFLTEPTDRFAYVQRLLLGLKPGGQAIIGTFAIDGPPQCSGLPVFRCDAHSLAEILGASFALVESRQHLHRTPAGTAQRFQFSRFQRQT
jgi:SAM-dependent methyltransferase